MDDQHTVTLNRAYDNRVISIRIPAYIAARQEWTAETSVKVQKIKDRPDLLFITKDDLRSGILPSNFVSGDQLVMYAVWAHNFFRTTICPVRLVPQGLIVTVTD